MFSVVRYRNLKLMNTYLGHLHHLQGHKLSHSRLALADNAKLKPESVFYLEKQHRCPFPYAGDARLHTNRGERQFSQRFSVPICCIITLLEERQIAILTVD